MAAVEQKKQYAVVKDFKGVNTKNNRTVIENGEFGWLENAMPIGFGNLRVIEGNEEVQATAFTANVTYMGSVNIQNNEYVLGFQDDGSAQFVNLTTNTKGNIAAAGTFSNADVMITQWKNERALIIDPNNGYKTWDGTDLHDIGSVNSVEHYKCRWLWVYGCQLRTVSFGTPNQANANAGDWRSRCCWWRMRYLRLSLSPRLAPDIH
jgi:hypothetical protein